MDNVANALNSSIAQDYECANVLLVAVAQALTNYVIAHQIQSSVKES